MAVAVCGTLTALLADDAVSPRYQPVVLGV